MPRLVPCRATFDGTTRFRWVKDFHHATLCRAFELDQASFDFDLPRTAFADGDDKNRVSGYIKRNGQIVGTIHVALPGEKFRDIDPTNWADKTTLRQTSRN